MLRWSSLLRRTPPLRSVWVSFMERKASRLNGSMEALPVVPVGLFSLRMLSATKIWIDCLRCVVMH